MVQNVIANKRRREERAVSKYAKHLGPTLTETSVMHLQSQASWVFFTQKREKRNRCENETKEINQCVGSLCRRENIGKKEKDDYLRSKNRASDKEDLNRW